MPKNWTNDDALVSGLTDGLFDVLHLFPKCMLRVDALSKEFKMPFSQLQILCALDKGPVSIGQLSNHLGIAKPNVTPLIELLSERGLVEKAHCEEDRRKVILSLTEAGRDLAALIRQSISAQLTEWSEALSMADARKLNGALACLVSAAQQISDNRKRK